MVAPQTNKLNGMTNIAEREFNAFCETSDGNIAKNTCSEITNTTENPVPVSLQYEGVGEANYKPLNVPVVANTIKELILEDKLSTIEFNSRNNNKILFEFDDILLATHQTVECGCEYTKSNLRFQSKKIYFKVDEDDIIEVRQFMSN